MNTTTTSNSQLDTYAPSNQFVEMTISNLLVQIGIFPNKKGHFYAKECILQTLENYESCEFRNVYDIVANKYNSNMKTVESRIRSCIKSAANFNMLQHLNTIIGIDVVSPPFTLSNSECIAIIAQYIYYTHIVPCSFNYTNQNNKKMVTV